MSGKGFCAMLFSKGFWKETFRAMIGCVSITIWNEATNLDHCSFLDMKPNFGTFRDSTKCRARVLCRKTSATPLVWTKVKNPRPKLPFPMFRDRFHHVHSMIPVCLTSPLKKLEPAGRITHSTSMLRKLPNPNDGLVRRDTSSLARMPASALKNEGCWC